ncbi:MAG: hypothetical protein WCH78_03165 [Bacteroidota bacterium]
MKPILFLLFPLILTILGCSNTKISSSIIAKQGILGIVTETRGNQMPMKGAPQKMTKIIQCTVLVYEPTTISDTEPNETAAFYTAIHTKQIAAVDTDSTGEFKVNLPIGKYSLFIKMGDRFYANLYDQFNHIALFEVLPNGYTTANLKLIRSATY